MQMFTWLEPVADGCRNYLDADFNRIAAKVAPEELFLDKEHLLNLTAPERVALTGGRRAMNVNYDNSAHGVFTDRVGVRTNDFFAVLTSMDCEWKQADAKGHALTLNDRMTGQKRCIPHPHRLGVWL